MTPADAERRARALLGGATPGPWDAGAVNVYATAGCPRHCVGGCPTANVPCACVIVVTSASDRDRLLIAATPDLARDVLSLADALRAAEARAVAAEASATRASVVCCPECDGGTVVAHVGFGHESSAMEPQSCDECGGSGRVTWARMASLCVARGERIARVGTAETVDEGLVF